MLASEEEPHPASIDILNETANIKYDITASLNTEVLDGQTEKLDEPDDNATVSLEDDSLPGDFKILDNIIFIHTEEKI